MKSVLQRVYHKGCIVKGVSQNVYCKYDLLGLFFVTSSFDIHTHERYKKIDFSFCVIWLPDIVEVGILYFEC